MAEKRWKIKPFVGGEYIKDHPGYSRVVLQLLYNRGVRMALGMDVFLKAGRDEDRDPFLFSNMEEAVNLIIKHIKQKSKILIYGDYDADGITAAALLCGLLETMHANVGVYMPDRIKEGYGLNMGAVKRSLDEGVGLIITVDNGIRSKEEVEYTRDKGADVVITDHHSLPAEEDMPNCVVVNPMLEPEDHPFRGLAGVGVAYKLGKALTMRSTIKEDDKKVLTNQLLDLVAIGTIADCVPLTGENRSLVKKGLDVLSNSSKVGIQELIKVAQIKQPISSWNIGFQLAPRINASARMDLADGAFELLISKDRQESRVKAEALDVKNKERQKETRVVFEEATTAHREEDKIIIAVSDSKHPWPQGIIGLVAGKLTERYYKPALVITKVGDEYKGSGRSIPEFDLIGNMGKCAKHLDKYGGHFMACGFSLKKNNLDDFIKGMTKIAEKELGGIELIPTLDIDMELGLGEVSEDLIAELEAFEPYGNGNPRPVFTAKRVGIEDVMRMGKEKEHIKFRFNGLWGVSFGNGEAWSEYNIGDIVDIAFFPEMNEFNGRREVQLKLVDIKESQD